MNDNVSRVNSHGYLCRKKMFHSFTELMVKDARDLFGSTVGKATLTLSIYLEDRNKCCIHLVELRCII